jgi:hypothetical protein
MYTLVDYLCLKGQNAIRVDGKVGLIVKILSAIQAPFQADFPKVVTID